MGKNIAEMFRVVSEGRLFTPGGFAWTCPECGAVVGESRCRDWRDRRALAHCLLHIRFRQSEASYPSVMLRAREGVSLRS